MSSLLNESNHSRTLFRTTFYVTNHYAVAQMNLYPPGYLNGHEDSIIFELLLVSGEVIHVLEKIKIIGAGNAELVEDEEDPDTQGEY